MKLSLTTLFLSFTLLFGCKTSQKTLDPKWETLFNESNLSGWDTYLGPQFKPGRTWDNIREFPALGFNNDTPQVFTVTEIDGKKAIRISGDYWGVAGAMFDVKTTLNGDTYQYDKNGTLRTFSQDAKIGRHVKKHPDAEKPTGEWNTVDLYCYGGTSVHVINGIVTMVLENSKINIDGKTSHLTKGKIQLQSEAAEVYYTDIKIKTINALPNFN